MCFDFFLQTHHSVTPEGVTSLLIIIRNYSRSQAKGVTVDAQFLTVTFRLKAEGV